MAGDEFVASGQVRGGDDRVDLFEWHVQGAKSADDLGGRDLAGRVAAVSGGGINISRFEQPDAVVVPQRLDGQVGGPGEIPDGQR